MRDWEQNHVEYEAECRGELGDDARECTYPRPNEADYGLESTPFPEIAEIALKVATYLIGLTTFLVAASFVGAELSSGSLANWLTFVPERWRVYTSKLVAVIAFALVVAVAAAAFMLGVAMLMAAIYDVEITRLPSLAGLAGRAAVVALITAVLGFAVALVTRHTAAAIGVLLGYLFVLFVRTTILFEQAWAQRLTRWTPEGNLAAIIEKGYTYAIPRKAATAEGIQVDYLERQISLLI